PAATASDRVRLLERLWAPPGLRPAARTASENATLTGSSTAVTWARPWGTGTLRASGNVAMTSRAPKWRPVFTCSERPPQRHLDLLRHAVSRDVYGRSATDPATGVQDGGSLAGKLSSEASNTGSFQRWRRRRVGFSELSPIPSFS